jgi:type I restriction-modification system DNA methylase subunit
MTEPYNKIKQLVKHFREQESAYLSPGYQESQVRQDFIDKFFTALGWDVTHELQKNPYEQEVKIENKVNTTGSQRRADYAFFIAPNFRDVKFFVEAKKPSRSLSNQNDYYQTIRYGWNSKTHIAVLTDFEELHILDCRFKPDIKTALDRKLEIFHYSDYEDEEKFKQIFYLLSRNEVANGSIEKYSATLPKPRGKAAKQGMFKTEYKAVDEAFLELLDGYREQLARAFKNKNQNLEGEELTEAVQRTIDRLVFIRFLEDKSIEEPSIAAIKDKADVWKAFAGLCKRLEPKYNGLVFKPHRIIDGQDFIPPDDKMFAEICDELANPTSPYDFDKIPISILGSIYERFLGKVVSTTEKRAKVIEKPEVRKAGGVYYTPEYIVRYIVNETVGKLLSDEQKVIANEVKQSNSSPTNEIASVVPQAELPRNDSTVSKLKLSPKQVEDLKIIDIACGSGSFLIEVYSQLLDYHTKYYNEFPEKAKRGDVETRECKTVLSLKKRQEILVNNIYGVDIDFQATEVTQLSLYLKLLEDVTMNDAFQYSLLKEKILPDLKSNIVCGNSLIGRDILEGKLFDDETEHTLKPMNFEDVFPDIMKRGGFDVVVGNPPWIDIKGMEALIVDYYFKKFSTVENRMNVYAVFLQVALSLLRKGGYFGYITPNSYTTQSSYHKLRKLLLSDFNFEKLIRLPDGVFKNVVAETIISILSSPLQDNNEVEVIVYDPKDEINSFDSTKSILRHSVHQSSWRTDKENVINLFISESKKTLIDKIFEANNPLINYCEFSLGLTPYDKYKGHTKNQIENRVFHSTKKKDKTYKPLLSGGCITRYSIKWDGKEWISYGKWLGAPRDQKFFTSKRIIVRQIISGNPLQIYAGYTEEELYNAQVGFNIILRHSVQVSLKYMLAIINSKLMNWLHRNKYLDQSKNVFQKILIENAKQLPIRTINFDDPADKARHDNIVKLVEQMLDAKAKTANAKTESETNRFEMLCKTLDRQIDEAVYELYGLTEEEIRIVEGKINA